MQDIRVKLGAGAAWVGSARLLINLVSLASTLVLARFLVPDDFGLVSIATTISTILGAVMNFSLASALVQHREPEEEHYHAAFTLNLCRGLLLSGVLALAAYPAAGIYGEPRLVPVMFLLAGVAALGGVANPKLVVLSRQLIFRQEFFINVAQKVVAFAVSLLIAVVWQSYWALLGGIVAGQIISTAMTYALIPFSPRITMRHVRDLWSFSVWLSFSEMINALNWRFDHLLIGGYLGPGTLGIYTVGDNLAGVPTREATQPISQTLFPAFARMAADPPRLRTAYHTAQSLICAIALPTGIGFALIAEPLVRLAMGERWLSAVPVIQVLSTVFALQSLSSTAQALALTTGVTRQLFRRDVIGLLVRVPLIVAGMLAFGLAGVVYARVLSGALGTFLNLQLVRQVIGTPIRGQISHNARSLASVAVMIMAVLVLQSLLGAADGTLELAAQIAACIICGFVSYTGAHLGLWLVDGKPGGPEVEVIRLGRTLRDRLRPQSAPGSTSAAV